MLYRLEEYQKESADVKNFFNSAIENYKKIINEKERELTTLEHEVFINIICVFQLCKKHR